MVPHNGSGWRVVGGNGGDGTATCGSILTGDFEKYIQSE